MNVGLAASNAPVNTTVTVKVVPASGAPTAATSSGLAGSVANSTATVNLPPGAGVITATATFNAADLSASLGELPLIDGQPPENVEVHDDG